MMLPWCTSPWLFARHVETAEALLPFKVIQDHCYSKFDSFVQTTILVTFPNSFDEYAVLRVTEALAGPGISWLQNRSINSAHEGHGWKTK